MKGKEPRESAYQHVTVELDIQNDVLYQSTSDTTINDGLTGLYNHKQFYERLRAEIGHAKHKGTKLFLLMMDIDQFKNFNEKFGTALGDRVLAEIGRVIQYSIRPTDFAARYGGEEFAVILTDITHEVAAMVADRIRYDIKQVAKGIDGLKDTGAEVTVSIGIAGYPDCTNDMTSLVDIADVKMYEGKEMGGDQVVV